MIAINILEDSMCLKDILQMPQYRLHSLVGNLKGIYAMDLGKRSGYRLLIIPLDINKERIISNDMGIYTKTVCVQIEEVSNHYEWD